ncbi:MAG: alpha-rhamnosidase, partial [Bombilactobacillus sp.]|nr:alpha-rhamnosidase [Bombilactobacillus sp.]
MVFKFQINKDVEFNHDDDLLKKADQYRPKLLTNKISAKRLVELTDDPSKLENTGIKEVGDIEQLAQLKMTRNDHVIIDFGQHCVGKFAIHIEHVGSPMDAPVAFKVKFAEMPNEFRYNSQDYDGWLSKSWIQEEVIHLDRLPAELELPRRYSFRY